MNVICDGNIIESKTNVKYLGLIINETLSGTAIALNIIAKNNQRLKFVYRNTRNFNMNKNKKLAMALIQCHFDYACPAWYSGLTKRMKNRLQCAQNKIIRYVLNLSPITHIELDEFKIVKKLPVEYRVQQLKLNHMYDIVNGTAPDYMSNLLEIPPIDHHIARNST